MKKSKAKIKKVMKGLQKASKTHAAQAKTLKKVAKALKKASALHKKQSKVIEKHIKEMKSYGKKKRS